MTKAADNVAALNSLPANLAAKVGDTGDETIAGIKTFSASPVVPAAPTTDTQAASKAYADLTRYAVQNAQNSSYDLLLTDNGKHIYSKNVGAQTIELPANATVAFPVGALITIINNGTTAITVDSATNSCTMYEAGSGATGNRTLAAKGMATLVKVETDTWFITGSGIT
jgi:hypothetical protein